MNELTLEKAIEYSEDAVRFLTQHHCDKHGKAVALCIEAAKRVKKERHIQGALYNYELPGETKEN